MRLRDDHSVENDGFVMEGIGEPYVAAQCYNRPPHWKLPPHSHPFYQLIFITEGVMHAECANGSFDVSAGQVHIAPPGCKHALSTPCGFRQLGIDIYPNNHTRELAPLLNTYIAEPACVNCPDLLVTIEKISERSYLGNRISMARIASYMDALVLRTLETHTQEGVSRFDRRLSQYINERLNTRLSLKEIAQYFHMSVPHLERMTRRHFNSSVIDLHNQRRLERSRILLEASDAPVTEIAEELGFYDTAHFSTFFKQRTGIAPTVYRRLIWQRHKKEGSDRPIESE